MRRVIAAVCLALSLPAQADPLGLLDLSTLAERAGPFEPRIGQQQVGPLPDGTLVQITSAGDISVCDPGPEPAFGGLVVDILQGEMLIRECPELHSDRGVARLGALRDLALPRYAERVGRQLPDVQRAYDAALAAMPHAPVLCNAMLEITLRNWTSAEFEANLRRAMVPDRLPAYACTWSAFEPP